MRRPRLVQPARDGTRGVGHQGWAWQTEALLCQPATPQPVLRQGVKRSGAENAARDRG
jgi:hypothetical protein